MQINSAAWSENGGVQSNENNEIFFSRETFLQISFLGATAEESCCIHVSEDLK